ncbi:arginine N-succinyltransferase [Aliamphritea ceti]|uniref:arginine N-succinyltransferase n=1 Tax=Aliamphritea ceti TaxID=1524258 RepID=UPI0021C48505|nr:arginine N-succinyltransferase [Aliamphritea ceti]
MLIVRPVTFADLAGLERLAVISGGSMTTLPANRDHIGELINRTQQSLRKTVEMPGEESYHFVLVDSENGEILGVSGIDATVGITTPFYSYRIDEVVHASSDLQIHNRVPALHLCQDYTGAARLCTLFLDQQARNTENLQLVSRARMMFIAQQPKRFASRIISELQGIADENHQSPFWESLGRHFFSMDFNKANYLTGINSKGFIADLMPHYPVYVPMLSKAAKEALGKTRPDQQPVLDLLENEGFRFRNYVDIFDAGPTLESRTDDIRSVRASNCKPIRVTEQPSETDSNSPNGTLNKTSMLISNLHLNEFRCLLAEVDPDHPELSPAQAQQLQLSDGDEAQLLLL